MSFPYMNAHGISMTYTGLQGGSASAAPFIATGMHNMAQLPDVVDVSAMEFAFSVEQTANTGARVGFANTGASTAQFVMADGGPTGDATAAAALFTIGTWSNGLDGSLGATATPNMPLDAAGTSTTDLDADDWLNFRAVTTVTGAAGVGNAHINANYIYGKPGSIA